MKWTLSIILAALITFSSIASEFDDTLKLAEQGDADAQYNLALMYDNGQGVIQSNKPSYIWNAIAACV